MTYVSKKEKVFDLPEHDESSSTSLVNSESKLKSFASVSDRRAWNSEECQRYQHFYGLVNGSENKAGKSSGFKYIPFDVLLAILMAEKDAYIQELLEKQEESRASSGIKANVLFKSDEFEDSDDDREALIRKDAEVVALKNKIAGLESELDDYRETITKAMHKLEKMDAVITENNFLKEEIQCSQETIKRLEEKKEKLEKELEYIKKNYNPESLRQKYQHLEKKQHWDGGDCDHPVSYFPEREILIQQVEDLQKELETIRQDAAEAEFLRRVSEETSTNLEELSKENESFKQKLESMKLLEKTIEELKSQGQALTDKYKKESQKANDLLKQIQQNTTELEKLKKERDDLQLRVSELMSYENHYKSLKSKLHQVEFILDENEILNQKLMQLDRLELENEKLKMRIEQMKSIENQALEDKDKILQLQCVVVEQEDEIRKLLRHVQEASESYTDKNEINNLRVELEKKDFKLKNYEKQLKEIPVLELEIDKLKTKLQKCIEDFKADKDLLRRLQEELEACRKRCHELEEMSPKLYPPEPNTEFEQTVDNKEGDLLAVGECKELCQQLKLEYAEKGENTVGIETLDSETQFDKSDVENDTSMDESESEIHETEEENNNENQSENENENENETFQIDLSQLKSENDVLKNLLDIKEKRILELNKDLDEIQAEIKSHENLREILLEELQLLKGKTGFLEEELTQTQGDLREMGDFLEKEKKGKEFALNVIKGLEEKLKAEYEKTIAKETLMKLQKEEANIAKQELYIYFGKEISNLKNTIHMWKKLNYELGIENKMLRDMKNFLEGHEIKALKNLIARLRAEVTVLKSLSKPELQSECDALQEQVKILLKETDSLMNEIDQLKLALNSEKSGKETLEKEVKNLQSDLSACVASGKTALEQEVTARENIISSLKAELVEVKCNLENSVNDAEHLKMENKELVESTKSLESEQKELKNQINLLRTHELELVKTIGEHEEKQNELNKIIEEQGEMKKELLKTIKEYEEKEKEYLEKTKNFQEISAEVETYKEEISNYKNSIENMRGRINDLEVMLKIKEDSLKLKEEELESAKCSSLNTKNEFNKLKSEMDFIKSRLKENNPEVVEAGAGDEDLGNYEKDLAEKYALEEALRQLENELDNLKSKLEECKTMEEEMSNLKCKRDSLLQKMSGFENEIDSLKKKLYDFESLKSELDELKASKISESSCTENSNLNEELSELKITVSNLQKENESLKEDLKNSENLLEVYKSLKKSSIETQMTPTAEFFTPPPMLSPRSSDNKYSNPETIALEAHKQEIEELKSHYEQKIQNIIKMNAEKLKKLNENYEKEAKCRTKIYYESINAIKSGYENDIKKLVEKHKISIMRLQGLHEDEVQELNTMYETQMEAMQTQNENLINDIKTENAEKTKLLREQHNHDIRELTVKYEELFKQKEAQFLADKANMEANLAENANGMKDIHQRQIDDLTQFYQKSMAQLEEKQNQELKKLKKSNLKRIELIRNKYEALLVEERKKYEEQLEEMLIQLRNGQKEDKNETVPKKSTPPASPSLNFHEVLQKILNEGLECLTIEELILVHSKTCFIPQILEGESGVREFSPRMGDGCRHRVLMTAEKEELLKRIFTLEHEIVIKQLETHEAIVNMEAAEMCRIQELKNALCSAQQKNAELKQLLSNQSKYEMDLKIDRHILDRQATLHETNVVQKVKELERIKADKRRLEEELQMEKLNVKNLTAAIEAEKERHQLQRKRDAEYVESMRQRLEEALNHEQMMENQLDYEVKLRTRLEAELQDLERSLSYLPDFRSPPMRIDITPGKNMKNSDESEVTKETKVRRSKSRHRSKLKAINN